MVIRLICTGMYTIKFQVNLEARVVFCSSVGRGLIEEAKSIFADYLLLCGSRNQSHRWKTRGLNLKIFSFFFSVNFHD